MPASPRPSTCTGTLYPGEMDRYADRLDEAATEGDAAKCGQLRTPTKPIRGSQGTDLGRLWRARRNSNPQPSNPKRGD